MSYKFDKKIIHDDKPMWDIACSFINRYEFIKEQVERSEKDKPYSIIFEDKVVMQWNEKYKKVLSDYKKELEFMDNLLFFLIQRDSKLKKYIEVDS